MLFDFYFSSVEAIEYTQYDLDHSKFIEICFMADYLVYLIEYPSNEKHAFWYSILCHLGQVH